MGKHRHRHRHRHRQRQRKGEVNLLDLLIIKYQICAKTFA